MKLTTDQLQEFDKTGYLFLPGMFPVEEAKLLSAEAQTLYATKRKEVQYEPSGVARTAFAAHTYNESFRRLSAHPNLIEPVEQLLGGPVYMHQFRVNARAAFDSDTWQWHQNYGTWKRDHGMPAPRAVNIAIFLDDVIVANSPLLFIPGSHKHGVVEVDADHDMQTCNNAPCGLNREKVTELADASGCVTPTGPAGSMLLFSSLLVHASLPNISPCNRTVVYSSLCHVDNHITKFGRDDWLAHRDFTPVSALNENCLSELIENKLAATG